EERITKTAQDAPTPRKRRSGLKIGISLLLVAGALGYAVNYYIKHRPTSEAEIARIEALIAAGKGDEARALMVDAQVRSRDVQALRLRIGRAFLHEGQIGPATALLSQVEGSLMKEERLVLAEYFLVAGDPFSAARFYDAALKTGMARTALLLARYGEALSLSASGEAAVAAFRESLALDASNPRVRVNLALTLANMNRLDEARIEALGVLKTEPGNEKAASLLQALGGSR
ncbi:MAG: tetratricopeptide repeat protein, partial [Vicinamibacteria bacterium]